MELAAQPLQPAAGTRRPPREGRGRCPSTAPSRGHITSTDQRDGKMHDPPMAPSPHGPGPAARALQREATTRATTDARPPPAAAWHGPRRRLTRRGPQTRRQAAASAAARRRRPLAGRLHAHPAFHQSTLAGGEPLPFLGHLSTLLGLTRKDVQRLLAEPDEGAMAVDANYNRAARVLTGWVRDAEFGDAAADPACSKSMASAGLRGLCAATAATCRRVLCSTNCCAWAPFIQRLADGRIELRTRAYVPSARRRGEAAYPGH